LPPRRRGRQPLLKARVPAAQEAPVTMAARAYALQT
jgi:hypothetical protein